MNVTDPWAGSNANDPNNAPKVMPDTLYFGTIQPGEKDFYTIDPATLPAGSTVNVKMSPIGGAAQDADLLLVGPPSTAVRRALALRRPLRLRRRFGCALERNALTDDPGSDSNAELAPESLTDLPLGFTPGAGPGRVAEAR